MNPRTKVVAVVGGGAVAFGLLAYLLSREAKAEEKPAPSPGPSPEPSGAPSDEPELSTYCKQLIQQHQAFALDIQYTNTQLAKLEAKLGQATSEAEANLIQSQMADLANRQASDYASLANVDAQIDKECPNALL